MVGTACGRIPQMAQHTPTRDRIALADIQLAPAPQRRPDWIRVRAPMGEGYENIKRLMRSKALHTVCEEAMCPNTRPCLGTSLLRRQCEVP